MQIQVNTDHTIDTSEAFIARLEVEIRAVLARFTENLTRIEVHLSDDSAGRSSGEDKRCMLEARPAGRTPVAVTHHAATIDEALHGAAHKLARLLDSESGSNGGRTGRDTIRGKPTDDDKAVRRGRSWRVVEKFKRPAVIGNASLAADSEQPDTS